MRGAGKTLGRGGADGQGELSFTRMYEDAVELTDYVRTRLGVEQVLLLANSFGSAFGLRLARQHPDRYSAYVGTDQKIHDAGQDSTEHLSLLARLRAAGKRKELAAVEEIGPDPRTWTPEQHGTYSKIVATADPLTFRTMKSVVMKSLWILPAAHPRRAGHPRPGHEALRADPPRHRWLRRPGRRHLLRAAVLRLPG
ncbi:alpha/beta fold hydrolase [Streptomyces sp. NPDC050355]|uniref:alpha/beta fold hydrolase n=1 Tax=Streptomyces sp. NPDC050355 TaxID=3365609 RepID=UPI0037881672